MQQLVEVRSSVIAVPLGTRTGLQQLEAVPGGDIAGHAALDGHDDGDLEHRPAGGGDADRRRPGGLLQRGEAGRIPDAGHVSGQMRRRRRGQQPAQVRADHVAADQQPQGAAEGLPHGPVAGRDPSGVLQPPLSDVAPVLARRGPAAGMPPVLPGSARLRLQPVQHPDDPQPPGITGLIVVDGCVWTGHRLGYHRAAAGLGRRPASGNGARRELLPQGGGLGGQAASPRCCVLRARRRDHGDVCRNHRESPNNASSASGR